MTGTPVAEAKALYEAGRYTEAEAEARAVARSRPRDDEYAAVALNIAALATGAQGRHAEALATYDEALPAFSRYLELGRGRPEGMTSHAVRPAPKDLSG
nr:tetratricopeptide repeat protein [Streptomyces resistomycificus]